MDAADSLTLNDLTQTEQAALVALVKIASRSDNNVSRTEELMLHVLEQRLGTQTYAELATYVDQRIGSPESMKRLLQEVTRPEARELIMGTALQILSAETINSAEDRVLSLASETWNLEPKFLDFPDGGDDEPVGPGGEGGTALA
ncbi:MAG: hypothetical protein E6Q99_05765 [Elusimicrobia bacterium]|nr:MAG: hypothetical protein E6Q99_05765 [Elusimicrobiota bacterium]